MTSPSSSGRAASHAAAARPHASLLLGRDHLERIAPARAALLLHLDEAKLPAPPCDQVELVAARPDVRAEHTPAAQAVPAGGPALGG